MPMQVRRLPHALGVGPERGTRMVYALCRATLRAMTWSILARDERTGNLGIAVASRFFAVGACVPHVASRVGAVATQALLNSLYGTDGLRLLRDGVPPENVVRRLIANDLGRDHRQVHV